MTTLEERLRDAYHAVAGTVRPENIRPAVQHHRVAPARGTSRLQRRFSMFAPLAAAASVVAAIGAAFAIPGLVLSSGHQGSARATSPAAIGAPPFMVELTESEKLAVQQTGTRHVTALIPVPHGPFTWDGVAAAGDGTFIAAATSFSDRTYTSELYRFNVSAAGKPSQLIRLSSGIDGEITALTASLGGHRIAYTTDSNQSSGSTSSTTLSVITGTSTRHWTAPALRTPGSTGLLSSSLSLSADGSDLGYIIFRVADTAGPVRAAGTVWLLPVDSASGSATARSHKITAGPLGSAPFSTVLSADGRTMYVLSMPTSVPDSGHTAPSSVTLSAYSTADGALLRTIHTWTGLPDTASAQPAMTAGGGQLLVFGLGSSTAYQVDPASGAIKPVWVYSLGNKNWAPDSSDIAW
jgi:hypothetical protein